MEHFETDGGEGWRKWQIYMALAALMLTLGTVIFRAGISDARTETRITQLEVEQAQMRTEFARRDIVESKLADMEKQQGRIELLERQQAEKLDEILLSHGISLKRSQP